MSRPHRYKNRPKALNPAVQIENKPMNNDNVLRMIDCHLKREHLLRIKKETRERKMQGYITDMNALLNALKELEGDIDDNE